MRRTEKKKIIKPERNVKKKKERKEKNDILRPLFFALKSHDAFVCKCNYSCAFALIHSAT